VELQELGRGLWRWKARHPEWEPRREEDDPADWSPEVGCVAYEAGETLVLIDPLVSAGDYESLDRLAHAKAEVSILTTIKFHRRSREELTQRYDATTEVPEGVEAIEIDGAQETMYWIGEHAALVPGDRILGDRAPVLRMCPPSWLRYIEGYSQGDLRDALRAAVLPLPVEQVLVSHGEPVLEDGHAALARALA
jgi:hypothetical protein